MSDRGPHLYCDHQTRDPLDGMRTICGHEYAQGATVPELWANAAHAGWGHTDDMDTCPNHT
jgi:hypothetical protein